MFPNCLEGNNVKKYDFSSICTKGNRDFFERLLVRCIIRKQCRFKNVVNKLEAESTISILLKILNYALA